MPGLYSFYRFWVIKEKPTRGVKLAPTHIRVKMIYAARKLEKFYKIMILS